jgi:hypothetical protein
MIDIYMYNKIYCWTCDKEKPIRSIFTKSKKIVCSYCESQYHYETIDCDKCNYKVYVTLKLDEYKCPCGNIIELKKYNLDENNKNKSCVIS